MTLQRGGQRRLNCLNRGHYCGMVFGDLSMDLTGVHQIGLLLDVVGLESGIGCGRIRQPGIVGPRGGFDAVDDDGMVSLAAISSLQTVMLDGLWVSEGGLEHLVVLEGLKELTLAQTLVGDEALSVIARMKKLRRLRLAKPACACWRWSICENHRTMWRCKQK